MRPLAEYLEDAVHGCTCCVLCLFTFIDAGLLAKLWGFISALAAFWLEAALGKPVLLPETAVLPAHDMEVGSANVPLGRAALHERD